MFAVLRSEVPPTAQKLSSGLNDETLAKQLSGCILTSLSNVVPNSY